MSTDRNKSVAKKFLVDGVKGASDLSMLADDCVFWNPLLGKYPKEALGDMPKALARAFQGELEMTIDGVTAEEQRVAIEAHSRGTLVDGKAYANTYHFLFEFNDAGKIRRINEHLDTKHLSETLAPLLK